MPWTPIANLGPSASDAAVAGYVGSASATRTALNGIYGLWAPVPTGVAATDTANLQALITTAQSTGGTLYLQAGTYVVTALTTASSGIQPRIIGKGNRATIIQGTTAGSALTFVGNQTGAFSGGYLADIGFTGTGVGLEIRGCVGVRWERVAFSGLSTGILFNNFTAGDFTEFCSGQADFAATCVTALEYRVVSGTGSFNGTGLTGASTINQPTSATLPSILIGANASPYNAPLSVMIWVYTAAQPLIKNNGLVTVHFHGALQMELFGNTAIICDTASANTVYFVGAYNVYGGIRGGVTFGKFVLAEKVTADQTGIDVYADTGWVNATVSLTNMVLGNGTLVARWRQVGKNVQFAYNFTLGSTSTVSANPAFGLPVNAPRDNSGSATALLNDGGVFYRAVPYITTSQVLLYSPGAAGIYNAINATTPFTFATGHVISVSGTYESV